MDDERQFIMLSLKDLDRFVDALVERLRHEGNELDKKGHSLSDDISKGAGKGILKTCDCIEQEYSRVFRRKQ